MTTKNLLGGMKTATGRYADDDNIVRFVLAYYTRFAVGFIAAALNR